MLCPFQNWKHSTKLSLFISEYKAILPVLEQKYNKRGLSGCIAENVFDSRPLGEGRSQLGEHARAGREGDEGLATLRQSLMIATEPTPPGDPGEAALDHPSSGKGPKARGKELLPVHILPFGHE
jgi:hypothetical protein